MVVDWVRKEALFMGLKLIFWRGRLYFSNFFYEAFIARQYLTLQEEN